jgi:hypothetical protein
MLGGPNQLTDRRGRKRLFMVTLMLYRRSDAGRFAIRHDRQWVDKKKPADCVGANVWRL